MEFTDKIDKTLVRVDFSARSKDDALRQIANIAVRSPLMEGVTEADLYAKLAEREAAVSTGIGGGIAIPHARLKGLADLVVFVLVAPRGVAFEALDKRKVGLFFVVLSPEEKIADQLKILASISRIIAQGNLKAELLDTTDPDVLLEILARASEASGETGAPAKTASGKLKLLYAILYYEEDLRAVLEFLIDQGIEGATVFDSKGMGAYVSSMPLFASFLGFMREDRNVSNTVMALIPAEDEQKFVAGIEAITGDLDKTQGAMLITLDVSFSKGTMNMIG